MHTYRQTACALISTFAESGHGHSVRFGPTPKPRWLMSESDAAVSIFDIVQVGNCQRTAFVFNILVSSVVHLPQYLLPTMTDPRNIDVAAIVRR